MRRLTGKEISEMNKKFKTKLYMKGSNSSKQEGPEGPGSLT